MRILLDECVPRALKKHLRSFPLVLTVPDAGLAGLKNGELLRRAAGHFDVFITTDRSIQYQQNLVVHPIALILLHAASNDIAAIAPLVEKLLQRLDEARRGNLLVIE